MITVANCGNLAEAQMFRSRLEAAGIPAFAPDADGLLTFMGGFRVQVSEEHAETARQLLQTKGEADENV
jgi:hypothetical protein